MLSTNSFENLGVPKEILSAISSLGYEVPSPIQEQCIPVLAGGRDLLAQAHTGSGKTAAFAIPIVSYILSMKSNQNKNPSALVLAPTREIAIQVAEAFKSIAKNIPGFHVLPIYGGQEYRGQLKSLQRGAHVVVGTPGRTMDHLRRGTLVLDNLKYVILDEADEMLNMGFIDDVKWILEQVTGPFQRALFSATMPSSIINVAKKYLDNPVKIHIQSKGKTLDSIEQSYIMTSRDHKMEALTRYLELEDIDAGIVFTKTKNESTQLAEKLEARGYAAAALNGDMNQSAREKVIDRIKRGSLDIIVATEVAARGLDVERISHVINYDIPFDAESYIHRIGRTGRAGRTGKTVLFITPRESRSLRDIERGIQHTITEIKSPTISEINAKRAEKFSENILNTLANTELDLDHYRSLVQSITHKSEHSELEIAAVLAYLLQKDNPLLTKDEISHFARKEAHQTQNNKFKDKENFGRKKRFDDRNSRSDYKSSGKNRSADKKSDNFRSDSRKPKEPWNKNDAPKKETRSSDKPWQKKADPRKTEKRFNDASPKGNSFRNDSPRKDSKTSRDTFRKDAGPRKSSSASKPAWQKNDRPSSKGPNRKVLSTTKAGR